MGKTPYVGQVAATCHFTGLYLVLIVTLLMSMGIIPSPDARGGPSARAGKGIGKDRRHC